MKFSRPEAEKALLSSLIAMPELIPYVSVNLRPDHFFKEENKEIYRAVLNLHEKKGKVTFLAVGNEVGAKLKDTLEGVRDMISTAEEALDSSQAIIDQWMLREMLLLSAKAQKITDTSDPWQLIDEFQTTLFQISKDKAGGFQPLTQAYANVIKTAMDIRDGKIQAYEPYWGLAQFERECHGVGQDEGELVIVSARPGVGKSSLFNNRVVTCVRAGRPVVFWSGEMSSEATLLRYLAGYTGIASNHIKQGLAFDHPDNVAKIEDANSKLGDKVLFQFGPMIWEDLKPQIIHYHLTTGCKDFLIDRMELLYMQKSIQEEERIKRINGELRLLATKYRLRIDMAVQMRKSSEDGKFGIPTMADVLGGTATTNDATKVVLLYRPEVRGMEKFSDGESCIGRGELILCKNTMGPVIEAHRLDYARHLQLWKEDKDQPWEPTPF